MNERDVLLVMLGAEGIASNNKKGNVMAIGKAVYDWTCSLTYIENEEPWTEEFDFQTNSNDWDHAYEFATRIAEEGYEPDYADLIVRQGWVHIEGSN